MDISILENYQSICGFYDINKGTQIINFFHFQRLPQNLT